MGVDDENEGRVAGSRAEIVVGLSRMPKVDIDEFVIFCGSIEDVRVESCFSFTHNSTCNPAGNSNCTCETEGGALKVEVEVVVWRSKIRKIYVNLNSVIDT